MILPSDFQENGLGGNIITDMERNITNVNDLVNKNREQRLH